MTKGFTDFNTGSNDFNVWQFLIQGALAKIRTAFLVEVINVYPEASTVDVLPLVQGIDAEKKELKQPPIYRVPYFSYRGGVNQIKITPSIGDYGFCIASDRDISNLKETGSAGKPATLRMFDARDSLYFGSFLNKQNALNYIEITPSGDINVKTEHNLTFNVKGDAVFNIDGDINYNATGDINFHSDDVVNIRGDNGVNIASGDSEIILKKESIAMQTHTMGIKTEKYQHDSNDIINNSTEITNKSTTNNIITDKLGVSPILSAFTQFGAQAAFKIVGDIDAELFNKNIINQLNEIIKKNNLPMNLLDGDAQTNIKNILRADEATHGTLTTNTLDDWDVFKQNLYEKDVNFKISIATRNFTFHIPYEDIKTYSDYSGIVGNLNEQTSTLATVELLEENNHNKIKFMTKGVGKEDGYITYLENITQITEATSGSLTTGDMPDYQTFVNSLDQKGLAFRIEAGGISYRYQIIYDEILNKSTFLELAQYIKNFNSDIIDVNFVNNKFVFSTIKTGSFLGKISYLKQTDVADTPANFISGELPNYTEFVAKMNKQDFAVKNTIDGNNILYYSNYDSLASYSSYEEFIENVFQNNSYAKTTFMYNNIINIVTKSFGVNSTITYFEPVEKIEAYPAYLTTGYLTDYEIVQKQYGSGENNITFFIVLDGTEINFSITPENLINASSWGDIANILNNSNTLLDISFDKGYLHFIAKKSGKSSISYLQYKETEGITTINGSYLLSGSEGLALAKSNGTDEIDNINPSCIEFLKLSEEYGARIINGTTANFSANSIYTLKGTQETGATIKQGKDEIITLINNSADLLRGTQKEGAVLIPGLDAGEEPGQLDGIATFTGKVKITDSLETEHLISNQSTTLEGDNLISGKINLQPYEVEGEGEIHKKSTVMVEGGTIMENLTVTDKANIAKLTINDSLEINGDISLNNTKIRGNGNIMSFDSDGVRNNKMFISSDYKAE